MTRRHAELLMYTAPEPIRAANERWLAQILDHLGHSRLSAEGLSLPELWLSPDLLLAQTCGYPLMTALNGRVRLVGRPRYELPDSGAGHHCSLILARAADPRSTLADFRGSRGVINSDDSNSGMNLLRQRLAPLQREGRFFGSVGHSGGHRESLRWLREERADLAAIDSVTYAYLARHAAVEVEGLRVVELSEPSPTLPFITRIGATDEQAENLRQAMNRALRALPDVAQTLGLPEVLPANESDYRILLGYRDEAQALGYGHVQ
ncbi:phosphate/phosphite/phosphonate ABC transporter substrate-binding protein [Pseudomonas sp. B35(2017)]|uniref:phosphate/phosphite/phosphonate ABC transporter substrate-binding protein n=1 Tax=Pseudomonas sp. B35(2017) TaxID=1981722 RepID=UPI000A1E2342|nr:PhnD/SsuA/transferrin family substrate-binding protein [Pseudomonas sp. B35(2017)]